MGSAFHQLCPRYSGTLTPTAPTAIRLWDTFTFFNVLIIMQLNSLIKATLSTGFTLFYKQFHICLSLFQFTIKPKQKQETEESRNSLVYDFEQL